MRLELFGGVVEGDPLGIYLFVVLGIFVTVCAAALTTVILVAAVRAIVQSLRRRR